MPEQNNIEDILQSLQGIQKIEGNPYLHIRVQAQLNKTVKKSATILQPVYTLAFAVALVLMVNVLSWQQLYSPEEDAETSTTTSSEYDLTSIDY